MSFSDSASSKTHVSGSSSGWETRVGEEVGHFWALITDGWIKPITCPRNCDRCRKLVKSAACWVPETELELDAETGSCSVARDRSLWSEVLCEPSEQSKFLSAFTTTATGDGIPLQGTLSMRDRVSVSCRSMQYRGVDYPAMSPCGEWVGGSTQVPYKGTGGVKACDQQCEVKPGHHTVDWALSGWTLVPNMKSLYCKVNTFQTCPTLHSKDHTGCPHLNCLWCWTVFKVHVPPANVANPHPSLGARFHSNGLWPWTCIALSG